MANETDMARLTRRQILRAGVSTGLAVVVSEWLGRAALASPSPVGKAKTVILLYMNGGPSHLDTWDPKTGPVAGPGRSIATSAPGLRVSEHLPRLARMADRLAVVRSMTSKEGNHRRAQYLVRTGYAPNPTVTHPTLAAWASKRLGEPPSGLPASVSLGGPSLGAGFFGVPYAPFVVRREGSLPENTGLGRGIDARRFEARQALLGGLEASFAARTGDPKVEGRRAVYAKADRLMHASALRAFDVDEEPERVRRAFGDTPFGRGCLTAVRLASAGVRFVEVTLDGWDTHKDNFTRTNKLMGALDPAMSALLAELSARGLFERTLVVWLGEFGRSPRINGNDGRDHHPAAWSAVLAGAGVRGGIVHGETDARGEKVTKDPVTVPNLLATVASLLGLDPADTVRSPAGRPISLTDGGVPVAHLLA